MKEQERHHCSEFQVLLSIQMLTAPNTYTDTGYSPTQNALIFCTVFT